MKEEKTNWLNRCILILASQRAEEMTMSPQLQHNYLPQDYLLDFVRTLFSDNNLVYEKKPVIYTGSADSVMYIFKLCRSHDQSGLPLILKVSPQGRNASSFFRMSYATDPLIEMGFKLPKIYFAGSNLPLLGGTFVLMEYLSGKSLLDYPRFLQMDILGRSHAQLHCADCSPLIQNFIGKRVDEGQYKGSLIIPERLVYIANSFSFLSEIVDWCLDRSFLWDDNICICHGDYHSGNILIDKTQISGIIDWSFALCNSCMDIAWTTLILDLHDTGKREYCGKEFQISELAAAYLNAYQYEKAIDIERVSQCRIIASVFGIYFNLCNWNDAFIQQSTRQSLSSYIYEQTAIEVYYGDYG